MAWITISGNKLSVGGNVANIVAATLSAVPAVGGPLGTLLADYIPTSRAKRLEQFASAVAENIGKIHDRIKVDYITTDEFAYLFTRTFQNVTREYQAEKLKAYKNFLVNSLIIDLDAAIKEDYLYKLESMTELHLLVLTCFQSDRTNYRKLFGADEPPLSRLSGLTGSLIQTLSELLPEVPQPRIESAIFDLDQLGITADVKQTLKSMGTARGMLALEGRLTPLGRDFIRFLNATN